MSGKELKKEFGDYQTPIDFAKKVCLLLKQQLNIAPKKVIEPTAGIGNFIQAALEVFDNVENIIGLEINKEYCEYGRQIINDKRFKMINENFFNYDLSDLLYDDSILFLGNPPWATNSKLDYNLPDKENFKHLSGSDAITGSSNFDICEYIILKIIELMAGKKTVIAMLCKTSVARNVLLELDRRKISVDDVKMYQFDANKIFDISASACLLYVSMTEEKKYISGCSIYDIDNPNEIKTIITVENGRLNLLSPGVIKLEGNCQYEWRQGVKHDCAQIMELTKKSDNNYVNKKKEEITIENTYVFPLMKSSSFKKPIVKNDFAKYVIVTQKKARDDTGYIEKKAPLTWHYLNDNKALFDGRKSSIYKGAPPFSMFGVGDYSYSLYKVGISGFYKKPLFVLLYNENDISQPVMVDDTSYFLSFDDYDNAYVCMLLLNSKKVQDFLLSISFQDAKRPFTKKVLQRLDINKCVNNVTFEELQDTEKTLNLMSYISIELYNKFVLNLNINN